ncbi:MAG TPA: hypothetical protein VGP46_11935 [Acidimicrobiales bacterium]|jgi:hypothetical protein|nr:hypothetical protein [Acidimicrobiales bacterium]
METDVVWLLLMAPLVIVGLAIALVPLLRAARPTDGLARVTRDERSPLTGGRR